MIKTTTTLIDKYDSLSGEVSFLLFEPKEAFTFLEGQFMMIETDCRGTTIKKPYSIATTSQQLQETKQIGFYIKKASDTGMSAWLTHGIEIGDSVTFQGPIGHYLDKKENNNYLFISTGSGLSPNLSLFQHLVYESKKFDTIVSVFGERYHSNIIPSIETLLTAHGDKRVIQFNYLSKDEHCPESYTQGYVQDSLSKALAITSTDVSVFLCGSPAMVKDVQEKLLELGVDKNNMVTEKR